MLASAQSLRYVTSCWIAGGVRSLTEKETEMTTDVLSTDSIKSDNVLVAMMHCNDGNDAVRLTPEVVEEIKKLEQYAVLSSHRIGEFRVG